MKGWSKTVAKVLVGLGVLLLASLTACGGQEPSTIMVDSPGDSESRDGVVTLREAILLTTGQLALAELDSEEADNVRGAPSAESSDSIRFDELIFPLSEPATISLDSSLPSLTGGNDVVDGLGRGVIVDGGGRDFDCFLIESSSNTIRGLQILRCRTAVVIDTEGENNTVGGAEASEGNVLSGNSAVGVEIRGASNVVKGNRIGTDASGTAALPNAFEGVWIAPGAKDNVIGGPTAGERNVISGNALFGLSISGSDATGNVIQGNYIGVDVSGRVALANRHGIAISVGPQNNVIGGTTAGDANVISANGTGILIRGADTAGNVIQGNYIGTDDGGRHPLGNAVGVWILEGAHDNLVGGTDPGQGNVISGNNLFGVQVEGAQTARNGVRGNSIYANSHQGIRNTDGGNSGLKPPTITDTEPLTGTACPNCLVDVYSDSADEGESYGGAVVASADGTFTFSGSLSGTYATATATDSDGNTSEFSRPSPALPR